MPIVELLLSFKIYEETTNNLRKTAIKLRRTQNSTTNLRKQKEISAERKKETYIAPRILEGHTAQLSSDLRQKHCFDCVLHGHGGEQPQLRGR